MPTGHYCGAGYSSAAMKIHSTVPYRYISNFALPGYMWSVRTPTTAALPVGGIPTGESLKYTRFIFIHEKKLFLLALPI